MKQSKLIYIAYEMIWLFFIFPNHKKVISTNAYYFFRYTTRQATL